MAEEKVQCQEAAGSSTEGGLAGRSDAAQKHHGYEAAPGDGEPGESALQAERRSAPMPSGTNVPFRKFWAKLSCRCLVSSLGPTQLRCKELPPRSFVQVAPWDPP